MRKIGLIGVGLMGHGIAVNLARHGHSLTILDHPGNQPVDDLVGAGVTVARRAAALASEVDILILCVTGTPQVEDVLFGRGEAIRHLRSGCIVVDCSTAMPNSTMTVARAVAEAGGRFLDAPMTRTPKEAAEGRLNLIVGGDADLFDEVEPVLRCFAENIVHAGPVGAGHTLKLLHNFVSLGFSALLAEASACSARAGIDTRAFLQVVGTGGGAGVVFDRLKPYLASGDVSAFRFTIANAHKDMGYYATMAQDIGASHALADAVRQAYAQADAHGLGPAAVPELTDFLKS